MAAMLDRDGCTGRPRLLMVDDEEAILRLLSTSLGTGEFCLYQATNGLDALTVAATVKPDIILLDLGLPDIDGVKVIRRIRQWSQVPIIVLSVRDRESDKMEALEAGADDYMTKPFSIPELLARIRSELRRCAQSNHEPVYRFGDLEVDVAKRRVTVAGEEVRLPPIEYELLRLLVTHADKVLTHGQILRQIWGAAGAEQQNTMRVNISHLRQKIEKDASRPRYIVTEPGVGYRLKSS